MFKVSFQEILISPQLLIAFDDRRIHAVNTEALIGESESFGMADVELEEGTGCAVVVGGRSLSSPPLKLTGWLWEIWRYVKWICSK